MVVQLRLHYSIDIVQVGADLRPVILLVDFPAASKPLRSNRLDLIVHLLRSEELQFRLLGWICGRVTFSSTKEV